MVHSAGLDLPGRTIAIHASSPAPAVAGCGACSHSRRVLLCQQLPEPVAGPPLVSGPAAQTERLLEALAVALQEPASGPDNRLLRSLHCEPGEVSLKLNLPAHCGGGGRVAQTAFGTLRRLLPDTDIYVQHLA